MEVLAWKRALSSPSRDDDVGASITAQESSNVEGYSSRTSGRAFWDSYLGPQWVLMLPQQSQMLTIQHNNQIIQGRGGGRGW